MNTLEIVLLSLLAGISIAGLFAIAGYLVWMLHTARRGSADMITTLNSVSADISVLKSQIDAILSSHRQEMSAIVARINGDKLVEASSVISRSAQRIETACVAFGQLATTMLSGDIVEPDLRRVRDSGLGPESYAPNPTGERWVGQSKTAAQDSDDLSGESGEGSEG